MPPITLNYDEHGWILQSGDSWEDHLGAEEALWCIVRILMLRQPQVVLRNAEQHADWDAKYGERRQLAVEGAK